MWDTWVRRARAAHELDLSSLSGEEAIEAHCRLDDVCDRVHAELNLPESTLVFFDPAPGEFWAYPW